MREPALELVAPAHRASPAPFATLCSGCWFLEAGRCRLLRDGKLRPRACTLYPWNVFGRLGAALVVAPQALCPLEVVPGGGVQHAEVRRLVERLGAPGEAPVQIRAAFGPGESQAALGLERRVIEAVGRHLGDPTPWRLLAVTQLWTAVFGREGVGELADLPDLDPGAIADAAEALEARAGKAARQLGLPAPRPPSLGAVTPIFAAFLPTVRLFSFGDVPLEALPGATLGLALILTHWQALAADRPVLPQAVVQLAHDHRDACRALAARWGHA